MVGQLRMDVIQKQFKTEHRLIDEVGELQAQKASQ